MKSPRATSRSIVLAATVLAVAAGSFFGAREIVAGDREQSEPPVPPHDRSDSPARPLQHLQADVAARIAVGSSPQAVTVGEGAVWVTVAQYPQDFTQLVRIDPETSAVESRTRIEEAGDVAAGGGAIWVLSYDRGAGYKVLRINPATDETEAAVPLDCQEACHADQLAVGDGAVWVTLEAAGSGEVVKIDSSTNEIIGRGRIPGLARDLAISSEGVWVVGLSASHSTVQGATLFRVDPDTAEVVATTLPNKVAAVSTATAPSAVSASHSAVWIPHVDGSRSGHPSKALAVAVDPATNEAGVPVPIKDDFLPFAADEAGVWFVGDGIRHLDADTKTVDETVTLSGGIIDAAIDAQRATIWAANYKSSITRLDLR